MNKPEWERYTENRFFVYDSLYSTVCRAAQPTFYGALQFMQPGRVIVTEPRIPPLKVRAQLEGQADDVPNTA